MKAKYNNLYKFLFLIFTMIGYSMTANANENILLLELKDGVVKIQILEGKIGKLKFHLM